MRSKSGRTLNMQFISSQQRRKWSTSSARTRKGMQQQTITYQGVAGMIPTAHVFPIPHSLSRVAWSILDCARRTSTFLSCAFREQEDDQATPPILRRPRVARARGSSQLPRSPLRSFHARLLKQTIQQGRSRRRGRRRTLRGTLRTRSRRERSWESVSAADVRKMPCWRTLRSNCTDR